MLNLLWEINQFLIDLNPDFPLFFLGIVACFCASVSDLRTRTIENTLTYGLIITALLFKLTWDFDINYFTLGFFSFLLFFIVAHIFFYTGVFAGGDAKLLMGMGALIPGASMQEVALNGFWFMFALLCVGVVWDLGFIFFSKRKFNIRKQNIPFAPAFLIALVIMIFFWT